MSSGRGSFRSHYTNLSDVVDCVPQRGMWVKWRSTWMVRRSSQGGDVVLRDAQRHMRGDRCQALGEAIGFNRLVQRSVSLARR